MTAVTVRDTLGAKVAGLSSVKAAYGNGSSNATVKAWPKDIVDTPVALIERGRTERLLGGGREVYLRFFDVHFYISAVDIAAAQRQVDTLDDEMLIAFRTDIQQAAGDPWQMALFTGSDEPVSQELNGKEFLRWTAHIEIRCTAAVNGT